MEWNLTDNVTDENSTNGTQYPSGLDTEKLPVLKVVHDVLIVILLVAVMFAMGCHITWMQLWDHIRRPLGILIGMCSQFILLPLSAFILINLLHLGILHGTGLLLLACSPGGVTSNIFTYFCDGDISLSIAMTTCSTLVALGMMPLNLYMYGKSLEHGNVVIPYEKMAWSLASVTCPVIVGMLVHWKFPRAASYITKIGTYAGFGIIIICQTMEFFIFPNIFVDVPWQLYLSVVVLPLLGFTLGYTLAWIFRQEPQVRRTISIESGVQNVGTALTIVSISFPFENQDKVLLFPWLYAFSMTGVSIVISAMYQLYIRNCSKTKTVVFVSGEAPITTVHYPNKEEKQDGLSNVAYTSDCSDNDNNMVTKV